MTRRGSCGVSARPSRRLSGAERAAVANPAGSLNVDQLLHLHTLTKEVSKFCQKQLKGYLDTMAMLFRPRRILGFARD